LKASVAIFAFVIPLKARGIFPHQRCSQLGRQNRWSADIANADFSIFIESHRKIDSFAIPIDLGQTILLFCVARSPVLPFTLGIGPTKVGAGKVTAANNAAPVNNTFLIIMGFLRLRGSL
jgi:hypothetical protein